MATAFSIDRFVASPPLTRARAVAEGLPVAALRALVHDAAVSIADLAQVVAPRRTLDRRLKDGGSLTPDESDRLARFLSVLELAEKLRGTRSAAMAWLRAPLATLGDERPLALMRTDAGSRAVETLLLQAQHGMLA